MLDAFENSEEKHLAVLGGGAAGFFAAISAKTHDPKVRVTLFEKTSKVLAKVKVSGGGRCNVTNGNHDISSLVEAYPRGGKQLKSIFYTFGTEDTFQWFENRGVDLKTEADGRVFPVSDDSQTIMDCLIDETKKLGISIQYNKGVNKLQPLDDKWAVHFSKPASTEIFDYVIVATGGSPKASGLDWLKNTGHQIQPPVPSLFTFNLPKDPITQLMGLSVESVQVKIKGEGILTKGPLLITHWGFSGPAVLVASSKGARILSARDYQFEIEINWLHESNTALLFDELQHLIEHYPQKTVSNVKGFPLPQRLWQFLLVKSGIPLDKRWNEVGKKKTRQLIELLTHDTYRVSGKTTFKEEFVTCGGVDLKSIELKTLESKTAKGLFFAGEVLDIDAITGGYNFQAAWSTGFIAGKLGN